MAIYCIGDIQGCDNALHRLWTRLVFLPAATRFICWGFGQPGPTSQTYCAGACEMMVPFKPLLGNHDLHLLAQRTVRKPSKRDTWPMFWKRRCPACSIGCASNRWHERTPGRRNLAHGACRGCCPADTGGRGGLVRRSASGAARPPAARLSAPDVRNTPDRWDAALQGTERLRAIVNAMTRPRFARWTA